MSLPTGTQPPPPPPPQKPGAVDRSHRCGRCPLAPPFALLVEARYAPGTGTVFSRVLRRRDKVATSDEPARAETAIGGWTCSHRGFQRGGIYPCRRRQHGADIDILLGEDHRDGRQGRRRSGRIAQGINGKAIRAPGGVKKFDQAAGQKAVGPYPRRSPAAGSEITEQQKNMLDFVDPGAGCK